MKTAKRKGSIAPKLTRQHAFYGKLPDDLGKEKRKSTAKYRWVWMIKNPIRTQVKILLKTKILLNY